MDDTDTFKYDPFWRRIYKSSSNGTSIYAYDGDNLIEETNASGTVVARYSQTENLDEPLAMLRSGTTSYYQADGLGSVTSLSSTAGAIANSYTYDSFGNTVASSGSIVNNFRYTAREFDTETNLQFLRARYYDPQTSRFVSEDPIGFESSDFNFYRYSWDDPVNFFDPSGLTPSTNWNFFWNWALGIGPRTRNYGPNDIETQEMMKANGAAVIRNLFYQKGCKNVTDVAYGTGHVFRDTVTSPFSTPFQVGGFAGASATNNGNGTVTFVIPNVAGTHSFFYHIVPDRSSPTGPMSNITQTFTWTEPINPAGGCGCK